MNAINQFITGFLLGALFVLIISLAIDCARRAKQRRRIFLLYQSGAISAHEVREMANKIS